MNVELTIQDCFDRYPALFKERADVLNQLFCTNGCGYEWVNGELVDYQRSTTEIARLQTRLVDGKAHQYNKLSLRAEAKYYHEFRTKNDMYSDCSDEMRKRLEALDEEYFNSLPDDVYYKKSRKYRWYFYIDIPGREHIDLHEKYVHLFNYPDDIKPDWKNAIEECRQLLIEDGYVLPEKEY